MASSREDLARTRRKLERLFAAPEVRAGFSSKEAALAWANQVAPLLRFNRTYHVVFSNALHDLHADISSYSIEPRWRVMMSQIEQALAELRHIEGGPPPGSEPVKLDAPNGAYVHPDRMEELSNLTSSNFDLSKLCRILQEINNCHASRSYFAIAALVRTVLDHVPPIFGCRSFSEVANSHPGGRSFKESMTNLENGARKIADQHLHAQIRRSEVLPNSVQVDFSNGLDVLLAEIVRISKP